MKSSTFYVKKLEYKKNVYIICVYI